MPHATLPSPGFQAFILCGPGASLDTFTSDPVEFPKAIVPIANRPMVWYPLDWCYRMGISDIFIITPPESKPALEAALQQNPHLTSLPSPRPTILAPTELTNTSGTGDVFRQKEVKDAIKEDFIVLPCDLVSELDGTALLQEWMVLQAGLGGATGGLDRDTNLPVPMECGGESIARRGAMGMWYDTKGEAALKGEETDFIITVPPTKPVVPLPNNSIRSKVSKLVSAMPKDSLNDVLEEKKLYAVRHSLLREFGRINVRSSVRDSHVYLFPFWSLELMQDERFESISEDVLGWWAKATWQPGLAEKLGFRDILGFTDNQGSEKNSGSDEGSPGPSEEEDDLDVAEYSSTVSYSKVPNVSKTQKSLSIPPIMAYIHEALPSAPVIKRVDTKASLLATSLRIARLPATSTLEKGATPSPLAHPLKIAHPDSVPRITRVEADTCLLAENVTIGEKCGIKESVIGVGCTIGEGVRLTKCLIMDNAMIGDNVTLTNCVLGPRCKVEGGPRKGDEKSELDDCEVQGGYIVPWGTEAKGEKFMLFEGLEEKGDENELERVGSISPLPDDGLSHRRKESGSVLVYG
ncbi:eukaryotic translation initiation factor-like protein subunit eIF2B-gamma [Microthyrium microscopicum]|uniref:Mannose-1-phosphate guanyltransferase n=1 Tax=Microthyrium microscopicum TaxID=703497 RepID=A0A6A6TYB1_9PEZI|nr:eukaryotic translation initiation factor-like protein subunit eIF2B-gamma [Microthyrium microscopicum]